MADPAFLFYSGDYLKDTQCLSEAAQVAYDHIMCEHMRNICISQERLNFFTKRLTKEQKAEVHSVLKSVTGGFEIEWVADSLRKRRNYTDSRRKNRQGKGKHMKTYDPHMEIENEIVIENVIEIGVKNEKSISVKAKYAGEKHKRIYDLTEYFTQMGQKEVLDAGWGQRFTAFMIENPGRVFDDDNHLYNSLKQFKPNGKAKAFEL